VRWGIVRVVTTGWRRVVTTRLAQGLAVAVRGRGCSSSLLAGAATVRHHRPAPDVAHKAIGRSQIAGWGRGRPG